MLVDTPGQIAHETEYVETPSVPVNVDEMFDKPADSESPAQVDAIKSKELESVNDAAGEPLPITPIGLTEEDMAERLWWDKCETLAKIKDCARMIEEVEGEVDSYQDQIKEAKEVLKGQQALLARYSSQLADILDGHPLPKNPNQSEANGSIDAIAKVGESNAGGDWRDVPTESLLAGVKGLGAKKLDAITEAAPTAGKLEELRGQASVQHKHFKEVLPKGCGESMADEIENRLLDLIAKRSMADEGTAGLASDDSDGDEYEDAE